MDGVQHYPTPWVETVIGCSLNYLKTWKARENTEILCVIVRNNPPGPCWMQLVQHHFFLHFLNTDLCKNTMCHEAKPKSATFRVQIYPNSSET